jgi:hypothetical protein
MRPPSCSQNRQFFRDLFAAKAHATAPIRLASPPLHVCESPGCWHRRACQEALQGAAVLMRHQTTLAAHWAFPRAADAKAITCMD